MKLLKVIILILVAAAVISFAVSKTHTVAPEPQVVSPSKEEQKQKEVENILSQMTLDEKIGQMLIAGFPSKRMDDHIKTLILDYHVGGVNLLGRNVGTREEVVALTHSLHNYNNQYNLPPFIISTDQEGGSIRRFAFLQELTPQGSITSEDEAYAVGKKRAEELKELGVNMNFSPVLDVVSDTKSYLYGRTFKTDATNTALLGAAMIRGYFDGGIIPVAKHFPGYGNIHTNPHTTIFDVVPYNKQNIEVFKSIFDGTPYVPVMSAHIVVPELDSKPATISVAILTGILRNEWKYNGVIITDDIEMKAVGEAPEKAAMDAVLAGADMIISTYSSDVHFKILDALKGAVTSGKISEERINESLRRIIRMKLEIK